MLYLQVSCSRQRHSDITSFMTIISSEVDIFKFFFYLLLKIIDKEYIAKATI